MKHDYRYTCAKCYSIARIPVHSWGPKTQDPTDTRLFFCSAGLFSHHGKARRTAVLKVTKLQVLCCGFFFFNVEEILCLGELLCLYSFYVFIFKPQGRRISWESITCHGWEIRFCAMIQRQAFGLLAYRNAFSMSHSVSAWQWFTEDGGVTVMS